MYILFFEQILSFCPEIFNIIEMIKIILKQIKKIKTWGGRRSGPRDYQPRAI